MKCFPDHKQYRYAIPTNITFFKAFKFSADSTWVGREFHILGPKTSEAFSTIINLIHYRNI